MTDYSDDMSPSRLGRRSSFFPLIAQRPLSPSWPRADKMAWKAAITPAAGPFGKSGKLAHLSLASQQIREAAYGNYLRWLEANQLLDPEAGPRDRGRPEWVERWLAEACPRLNARTLDMMLVNLSLAFGGMVPDEDWRWIRTLPGRPSRAEIRALISRRRATLSTPDTARLTAEALDLCATIRDGELSAYSTIRLRDALIIALSCYHAPRLSNLAELRIGVQLRQATDGMWWLNMRRTKNSNPLTPPLAARLVPHLEFYLRACRPRLLEGHPDHDFLWVNQRGLPLASTAFLSIFRRMGVMLIGRPLHPHEVRHGLATEMMRHDPRAIEVVAAALGHKSTSTSNQVYDRTDASIFAAEWRRVQKRRGWG